MNKKQEKLEISEIDLEDEHQLEFHIKQIKKQEIKEYFKINIFKISYLGMLTSINLIFALIGNHLLSLIPLWQFYVIEITFLTYILMWVCINGFYALLMVTPLTWIRLVFGGQVEWIGLLSMNLSDLTTLAIFIFSMWVLRTKIWKNEYKSLFIKILICLIIAIIWSIIWNLFANFVFIFPLYSTYFALPIEALRNWTMAGIVALFNIIKYSINFAVFISILKPVKIIISKHINNS